VGRPPAYAVRPALPCLAAWIEFADMAAATLVRMNASFVWFVGHLAVH